MVALGALARATLGTGTLADGLACTPTLPTSLSLTVAPGSITTLATVDAGSFGSLDPDGAPLVKQGVIETPTTLAFAAPTTTGQSINYLLQATFVEADGAPVALPYYNAANPAQPFVGPGNTAAAQNTRRTQRVQMQVKPGAPASAGTQATPAVDLGWVGLYIITVPAGSTALTAANIVLHPTAPFIPWKLPELAPGFSRSTRMLNGEFFVVPPGVYRLRVRVVGGGGGGGGCTATQASGGGGAGGYSEGIINVTPGLGLLAIVGSSGVGGLSGTVGGQGGPSSFAGLSATGGQGGAVAAEAPSGGQPGVGSGSILAWTGGWGGDGSPNSIAYAGMGGASALGGGGRGQRGPGLASAGAAPGSGGGGQYGGLAGTGGVGGIGAVIIDF